MHSMDLAINNYEYEVKLSDIYPQLIGITIMSLTSICGGLSNTFTNLLDDVTDETKSWLASTTSLFTIIGTLLAGLMVDKVGRKRTLCTINIVSLLAWVFILMANKNLPFFLFIGIPLTGVVRGGIAVTNVVFVSEITNKKYRSTMLSFTLVYFTFGIMLTSLFGVLISWKTFSLLCLIFFAIILVLAIFYTVESPIWLAIIKSDMNAANHSLKKLNPNEQIFEEEWLDLKKSVSNKEESHKENLNVLKSCLHPSFYKPATILFIILALSQICGVNFMMYYIVDTVSKIGHNVGARHKKNIFLIIGISKFFLSFFTSFLSTKFGRKQLLYASGTGTFISSVTIILCSLLYNISASDTLDCVMLLAFVIYMSFGSFGIWLIPYTLIGELLPNKLRGAFTPIFLCFSYGVMSLGAKFFPFILKTCDATNIFSFYAGISIITYIFVHFCVPETRGKALSEIEKYFTEKPTNTTDI